MLLIKIKIGLSSIILFIGLFFMLTTPCLADSRDTTFNMSAEFTNIIDPPHSKPRDDSPCELSFENSANNLDFGHINAKELEDGWSGTKNDWSVFRVQTVYLDIKNCGAEDVKNIDVRLTTNCDSDLLEKTQSRAVISDQKMVDGAVTGFVLTPFLPVKDGAFVENNPHEYFSVKCGAGETMGYSSDKLISTGENSYKAAIRIGVSDGGLDTKWIGATGGYVTAKGMISIVHA